MVNVTNGSLPDKRKPWTACFSDLGSQFHIPWHGYAKIRLIRILNYNFPEDNILRHLEITSKTRTGFLIRLNFMFSRAKLNL